MRTHNNGLLLPIDLTNPRCFRYLHDRGGLCKVWGRRRNRYRRVGYRFVVDGNQLLETHVVWVLFHLTAATRLSVINPHKSSGLITNLETYTGGHRQVTFYDPLRPDVGFYLRHAPYDRMTLEPHDPPPERYGYHPL